MDAKDELLAKLDAIDAQRKAEESAAQQKAEAKLKGQSPPPPSSPKPPSISTEALLAKLNALDRATRPVPAPQKPTPPQPAPPKPQPQPAPHKPQAKSKSTQQRAPGSSGRAQQSHSNPPVPPLNSAAPGSRASTPRASTPPQPPSRPKLFERLKQFTQAQLAAHAAENQAKAKRAQEIARAQAWLDELDPLSDDGFWFEQFAESYDSRLEAALVFLDPGKASQTKRS